MSSKSNASAATRNDLQKSGVSKPEVVETEAAVFRLMFASFAAVLMAGVAVMVSANTLSPTSTGSQAIVRLTGDAASIELSPEQLKQKALVMLRTLPDYYPSEEDFQAASMRMQERLQDEAVNVNTFLLSARVSNQSQLAELQMQPFHGEFNSSVFLDSNQPWQNNHFAGVGFPHIETNSRSDANRYKPYKQLVSFSSNKDGVIVPHIKCMGLSPEAVAKRAKKYDAKIFELAVKHNVSASLVKAVIAKESCYNPKARSHVGAIGLMQLMPATAKWLKVKQPENPEQNLAAGVRYLAQLRKRFGSNELALAAYNAGPGNVNRYKGIPPFAETQNYVQDVMYFYRGYVATTRFVNALNEYQ